MSSEAGVGHWAAEGHAPPSTECGDSTAAHRETVELLVHSRAALLAVKHTQKVMSHASQRVLVKTREGSRFRRWGGGGASAYLKPSALGMKRLGLGGSLWQRGTLTGRGLFLGAGRGEKKKCGQNTCLPQPEDYPSRPGGGGFKTGGVNASAFTVNALLKPTIVSVHPNLYFAAYRKT